MAKSHAKKENPWINILVNVAFPTIILMKVSPMIGPVAGLLLAMALPLGYGMWDLLVRKNWNFFSFLGIASILLTGGIGLLQLGPELLAWKEALIPGLIGLLVLATVWTPFPMMQKLLETLLDWERIQEALRKKDQLHLLDRVTSVATMMLSGSFFVSAVLNYVLAKVVVTSPSGTDAFNEELGQMTALSVPVITIPSFLLLFGIMVYLVWKLTKITGLEVEELMLGQQ